MFKLNDISIRNKLILMQVFTSIIVLGIFFVVFIISDVRSYKERKVDDMISLAQVIGTNSVSTLQFEDNEMATQTLAELHTVAPEIIHAGIIDKKGNLFASYSKAGEDSFHFPAALAGRKSVFTDHQLFVSSDIFSDKEFMGKVFLEVSLTELEQIKQSKYELTVVLMLGALVFSFLIAMAIQAYISKRLLYLVHTMKEVSRTGDYDKMLVDDGKDEISTLIRVFNNLMEQVKENQRRKDEFIGIASHELKTPLTSVKGYIELLNMMEEKEPNKQFVQKALDNVNKLERLIKDLLDVSKIQSGQLELNMKEFNIVGLLGETIPAFQMVSPTHEILWEDKSNGTTVLADRQRIEQVLFNLLSNAIKYSPGEKKVMVYSQTDGTELIIKIRDFGVGVPKEEQTNIFERFYRTKDMATHVSGFGLGLYICRDIIKRHDGRIWVETEEKGSAFYFSLPLKKTQTNESSL